MSENKPGDTIPLCQLRPGDRARMAGSTLCGEDCELLRAMGMSEHCELRVCRSGEPCIVQVNATRLGLSSRLTPFIMVAPAVAGP